MEASLNDAFLGDDNYAPSTREIDLVELEIAPEDAELAAVDLKTGLESSNETSPLVLYQSPTRKVHSAAPTLTGFGVGDEYEDIPRPYTAAGADSPPSSSSRVTRQRTKKHSALRQKTVRDGKTPREERPRSADVNGWGDFDTDRLLRDDSEHKKDRSDQTPLDPLDGQRSRSRKSRRSTPATPSPRSNPWEGYLTLETKESSRPPMQVLRPKSIEILNLDLAQVTQPSGRASATPKPLLGRASLERLMPSRSRPTTSYASRPATPAPLFGTEIPDTPKNRATIFKRFAGLWSLILRRSASPAADQLSEAVASPTDDTQTRSPFECSMTMVKLCKAVGISLTPSAATHLSFWYTNEEGVDFQSFCDLVIQGAIQPALHHFNLDNSIDEYVAALDTIVQSLVTTTPARRRREKPAPPEAPLRLKELNEIQPVFMSWKAGITPRLVQSADDPSPTPTRALVTAEKVRRALEASASQRMLAHQLPSEEARVTHVENIRRKVQLHKSWKFSSDLKFAERSITSPMTSVSRGSLNPSQKNMDALTRSDDLSELFERAHSMFPPRAESGLDLVPSQEEEVAEHFITADEPNTGPENDAGEENEEVLVCCSCSARVAVLWCSSCFTVNCQKCWQEVHSCTVDMSMVTSTVTSAKKPLFGPTTLAVSKKRCGSATLRPPVAMIYLPTKAMVSGMLARGNPIVRHSNAVRKISNQANSSAMKEDVPVVVANAILPSLHKSRSDGTILRHHERPRVKEVLTPATDSTADLVKSLMLRVSPSTPSSGSRSTESHTSMESAIRLHKHHTPSRPKLHLAPVLLDAALLLSHTPDRKR